MFPLFSLNIVVPDTRIFAPAYITSFEFEKFIPDVIEKIEQLKKIRDEKKYEYDIEVDGGINFENSKSVISAGANILVSGTTIFKENNGNIKKNIETLKEV